MIEADCAIVCEGQLDLITLFEAGLTNVVAPQGTAFTEGQARILKRYVNEVVLCFDADAAGQKASERSLEPLLENNLIVRVAEMPPGEDPDSLVRKEGAEKFSARVAAARDFFDFWIERQVATTDLTNLNAKMQIARQLAETVARVHDPLMRNEVISKVAARLGVSPDDFTTLLPKAPRMPNPGVRAANGRARTSSRDRHALPPRAARCGCARLLAGTGLARCDEGDSGQRDVGTDPRERSATG